MTILSMSHNLKATHAILGKMFKYSNICFANHLGSWHMAYEFSRIPDRDFRFFYPRETILSHIPVHSRTSAARWSHVIPGRHCDVKMTSPCPISANSGFSGSFFFHVFSNIKLSKKKNPLFV